MSRDAEAIRFEADYWIAALADIAAINDALPSIADELATATVAIVHVVAKTGEAESSERIRDALGAALDKIQAAQEPVLRLIHLAGGRVKALDVEFHGEQEGER